MRVGRPCPAQLDGLLESRPRAGRYRRSSGGTRQAARIESRRAHVLRRRRPRRRSRSTRPPATRSMACAQRVEARRNWPAASAAAAAVASSSTSSSSVRRPSLVSSSAATRWASAVAPGSRSWAMAAAARCAAAASTGWAARVQCHAASAGCAASSSASAAWAWRRSTGNARPRSPRQQRVVTRATPSLTVAMPVSVDERLCVARQVPVGQAQLGQLVAIERATGDREHAQHLDLGSIELLEPRGNDLLERIRQPRHGERVVGRDELRQRAEGCPPILRSRRTGRRALDARRVPPRRPG